MKAVRFFHVWSKESMRTIRVEERFCLWEREKVPLPSKVEFYSFFFFTPNPCDFHIFLQKLVVIFINQIITLSHKRRTDTNFLCFFFLNILFRFISIYTTRALNVKVMYVILSVGFCDRG